MDTISGALKSKDGQNKFHPETTIANVIGLEAELAKAITNLTANGGVITIHKADGSHTDITIATSTSAGGGGVTGVKGNSESTFRTGNVNITAANIGAATTDIATATKAGLMSAELFDKLDKIEAGAQKNSTATATTTTDGLMSKEDKTLFNQMTQGSVIGVKGSAETEYRTGNVNITAANVGAAAASHVHDAADITSGILSTARGGTGATSLSSVSVGSATKATQDESGNNIKASYAADISIQNDYKGHKITLKSKSGADLKTLDLPYPLADGTNYSIGSTNLNAIVCPGVYSVKSITNGPVTLSSPSLLVVMTLANVGTIQFLIPFYGTTSSTSTFSIYCRQNPSIDTSGSATFDSNWSIWRHNYYGN